MDKKNMQPKNFMNKKEASEYLKISIDCMTKLLNGGKIKAKNLKRRWLITKKALDEWKDSIQ